MRIDSGFPGLILAVGFVIMGIVGVPIAKWFVIAGVGLGIAVAVLLRFLRKRPSDDPDPLRNL